MTLIVFGVFYTALAISGAIATNPYGLQLGPGENAFHFIVGPLALVLGLLAQRESARASISARSAPTSTSASCSNSHFTRANCGRGPKRFRC